MQKLASEFVKTNVITKKERVILGSLKEVLINPDDGKAIGIMIYLASRRKNMVANTSSVVGFGMDFVMIESVDSISPPDEIIRIKEVLDKEIFILKSSVYSEDGHYLGKVYDYSVNLLAMKLSRIYVKKKYVLNPFPRSSIISENDIIKIEKGKIIVKSGSVKTGKDIANLVKVRKTTKAKIAH